MKTIIKHIFTAFLVLLSVAGAYSQQVPFQQWFNTYNNPSSTNDTPKKMAVDNAGNVYLTGSSDSTQSNSNGKTTTVKFSPNGTFQWVRNSSGPLNQSSYGTGGTGIAADNSGNIYVLSVTKGSQFNNVTYVLKYNSNGDTLWTKRVADTSDSKAFGDIKTDASGNIYAAYVIANSTGHYDDIGVSKLNSAGQILWQYSFNGPASRDDVPVKLLLDNLGNVFVTGTSQSLGFGAFYWNDIVTIKLNNSGALQWSSIYDGPLHANDYPGDMCLDAANNVYITGTMTPIVNNTNIIVLKIDGASGSQQWAKNPVGNAANPGDFGYGISVNQSGDVYVCGYMINTGTGPAVLLKLNSSGNEQWRRFYPSNSYSQFRAIKSDSAGNLYVTGDYYSGSVNYSMTVKYNSTGDILWNQSFTNGGTIYSMFLELLPGNACLIGGYTGTNVNSDMFSAKYLQVTPQTLTICKSTNKPIRDFQNTFDTVNISGVSLTAQIIDVQVKIDTILHTYVHDLTGALKGPSGLTDTIFKAPGKPQTGFNFFGCNITDSASHLIDTSALAPFTGYYKPYKPLSAFSGNNPNGAWILNVFDGANGDTGSVRKYCITISYFDPAALGIQTSSNEIPHSYLLGQNYPNPFNPTTNIKFSVPKAGIVKIVVYDILGKEVSTLVNEYKQQGTYKADFNGSSLASGVYFYKMEMADFSDVKKMVLIK